MNGAGTAIGGSLAAAWGSSPRWPCIFSIMFIMFMWFAISPERQL